jgi:hypothetical protein
MPHKRSPTLGAVTAIALLVSLPLPVRVLGQAASAPPASQTASGSSADYTRTMGAAQRAFNLHHWDDAFALFEQAHAQKPNARTLRGMGACSFEMHRYVAAAGYLTQALLDTRSPLGADQRSTTADLLARGSALVGNVQLELSPKDAELSIDGARVEVPENGELALDPGHHELSAKAPGYELVIVQVDVVSGQNALTVALPALPTPVVVAPVQPVAVAVAAPVEPEPPPRRALKRTLISTGAIVAIGGLMGAGTTGLLAMKRSDDLHAACPDNACPESQEDELDHARTLALSSNVLWGVAALGAGVCLLGILLPDGRDKQAVSTSLRLNLGGATLHGSF